MDNAPRMKAVAGSRIIGTGSALPQRAVGNEQLVAELAQRGVHTSDAWIVERTGIRQRYLAEPGLTTAGLGARAARSALEAAAVTADSIDLIVHVQAVCSGFVYGLAVADALLRTGAHRRALVIGSELFSRILDWNDRTTCVLFGDGAGAVVLEASDRPGLLAQRLHADGSRARILCTAGRVDQGKIEGDPFLRMDGQAVFKVAVEVLEASAREVLEAGGLTVSQLDWLIPHQANIRILTATARRLGLPAERMIVTVDRHGNTSAASVPLALDWGVRCGMIRTGHSVLLQGVGGGLTWGSVLVRM